MFAGIVSLPLLGQLLFLLSPFVNICDSQSTTRVTIVHTSDVHLHFAESALTASKCQQDIGCHGGLSRFVRFVDDLRGARSNLLVLDSGGLIPGRLLEVEGGQEAVAEVVKPLPYDAMAFGTMELSDGIDALAKYVRTVGEKFVCTNLNFSLSMESGRYLSTRCHKTMIKMYGELQIGIISYITKEAMPKSVPGITILDEVEALEAGISELEATSADISVILALGYSRNALDKTILRKVPKINLIIAGHSHMMFYNGTPPSGANKDFDYPHVVHHPEVVNSSSRPVSNQMVAGGYFHLIYAGKLKLMITNMKVSLDPQSASNPVYMNGQLDFSTEWLLLKHQKVFDDLLGKPIGFNTFLLDGSRECYRRECSMGNLLTDAMVKAAIMSSNPPPPPGAWVSSAVALLEGSRVSSSLERGSIYHMNLRDVLRNDTSLELLHVSGAELRQMLENSTRLLPGGHGSFLQVSGLQVRGLVPRDGRPPQLNISVVCIVCLVARYHPLDETASYPVIVTGEFAARITAPGGALEASGASYQINRTRRIHDSLFQAAVDHIKKTSPVLVGTGSRLMVRAQTGAAGRVLGGARWWVVACPALLTALLTVVT